VEVNERQQHVIIVGNPVDGVDLYGPFDGAEVGSEYAAHAFSGDTWWVASVHQLYKCSWCEEYFTREDMAVLPGELKGACKACHPNTPKFRSYDEDSADFIKRLLCGKCGWSHKVVGMKPECPECGTVLRLISGTPLEIEKRIASVKLKQQECD
jgi:Zn finger protein HypA/HybF involved in hydrogenase expression